MCGNYNRDDSRFAPSKWEMSSQSNAVSHWLGTNLESALYKNPTSSQWRLQIIYSLPVSATWHQTYSFLRNKLKWNLRYHIFFIWENILKMLVCEMLAFLFRPRCAKCLMKAVYWSKLSCIHVPCPIYKFCATKCCRLMCFNCCLIT